MLRARAGGRPAGPMFGIPFSAKDLYGVNGYPTFAGTPKALPPAWEAEGFLVRTLREQGAVIVGKSHTVEMAFGGLGTNAHWGAPPNPWDAEQHRVTGGSSSGAGVSLCEGSCLIALGSDTAGSIRIPASVTGNVGQKTSYGRWPADGLVPLSPTFDSVGFLTRSVADTAYAFIAIDPGEGAPDVRLANLMAADLSGVRIGVEENETWRDAAPGIADGVRVALGEFEKAGARIVRFAFPEFDQGYDLYFSSGLVAAECATFMAAELPDWIDILDPRIGQRIVDGGKIAARDYLLARRRAEELARLADERLSAVDVFATPSTPITPPVVSEVEEFEAYMSVNRQASRFTNPGNILNLCAISLPVSRDAVGMPVGLQLTARHGRDERLLGIALAAERVLGTARDRIGTAPLGVG